jgi:pyruvate dehydrogenase E2 component (dihydrolipoamide acetyltransferase)
MHAQIGERATPPRPAPTPAPARIAAEAPAPPRRTDGPVPAAPAIRRLAREMNIDLAEVHGTGPGGRIVREDLERYRIAGPTGTAVGTPRHEPAAAPPRPAPAPSDDGARPSPPSDALPDFSQWGPIRREPITQIRKTIARQMVRSYQIIPHVTHCDVADVTDLEMFRKQHGEVFNEKGTKLTLTTFIVKAVAGALQQFPQLNCSFDDQANEIVYKDYVHIGIAVDTPRGLVVPVIRDCDRKSLLRITKDLNDVAERARAAKFDIAELRGGTFTITNVGPLGGTFVTPMINYPEVAILGLGRMAQQPVVRDGQIVPRMILPLSLSFDHRVIDGADAARFTRSVISYLENPLNLLMVS